ncbi:MAG: RsmE family RNA methyltransferase [Patescibacteria group bacterium]
MRIHRFIGDFDFSGRFLIIGDFDILNQIKNVLRLKRGDYIILSDGKLKEAKAKIINIGKNELGLEITEIKKNLNESSARIILYCSVLKKDNFEWVAQKATEIGVKEIVPIVCEHTVKTDLNFSRLKKIIQEASEQSERGEAPTIKEIVNFPEAVADAKANSLNLFFDRGGSCFADVKKIASSTDNPRIGIFIGPEGGWTNQELGSAEENDLQIISLGKTNLRAETAAIIASYLVLHIR